MPRRAFRCFLAIVRICYPGLLYRCGSYDAGEEWFRPFGGAPSNGIVKFARGSLSDLMLVEYLCLSTARMCGVDVPAIDLLDLKVPALCIERYELKRLLTLFLK